MNIHGLKSKYIKLKLDADKYERLGKEEDNKRNGNSRPYYKKADSIHKIMSWIKNKIRAEQMKVKK